MSSGRTSLAASHPPRLSFGGHDHPLQNRQRLGNRVGLADQSQPDRLQDIFAVAESSREARTVCHKIGVSIRTRSPILLVLPSRYSVNSRPARAARLSSTVPVIGGTCGVAGVGPVR